jgi:hypothetical protein
LERTWLEKIKARKNARMRSGKLFSIFFILIITFGFLPLTVIRPTVVSAQIVPGFYEGLIPIQGAYLRAINTYPGITPDSDYDGVLDKGCKWDDNGDGVSEQHTVRDPLMIDLEAYGFSPGDKIMISFKQGIYSTTTNFFAFPVYGLFSSSKELRTEEYTYTSSSGEGWPMVGPLNRVPGAIDAALGGYVHGPLDNTDTRKQGEEVASDIPEDFRIGGYQETNNCKNGDPYSDDPRTGTWWFSNGFWISIPLGAKFLFFQVYGPWNVGDSGYCTITVDNDTDGDAIPDSWEKRPIDFNKDGTDDLKLAGGDFLKKDIYVEVDYMEGHRFSDAARDDVIVAFKNCPASVEDGPINVHIEIDDTEPIPIAHQDLLRVKGNVWSDFDRIKDDSFGTLEQKVDENAKFILLAKAYVYHYCLFVHGTGIWNGTDWKTGFSGVGEYYGNDFVVSLGIGGFENGVGSRDEQAATFMHELGHNLGLDHGGGDDINYKPNYLSIMNYLFQFEGTPLHYRPLTFSSAKLPWLHETNLNENIGVVGANWDWTVYSGVLNNSTGTYYIPLAVPTNENIDWNNNGDENENSVQANINNYPDPDWNYHSSDSETLEGYDDWSNLLFYFQENKNFAKGVHEDALGKGELTWEAVKAMREAGDRILGGPTGPVKILNVQGKPSPQEQDTPSPIDSNILVIAAVIVIVVVIVGALLVLRKRRKRQAL